MNMKEFLQLINSWKNPKCFGYNKRYVSIIPSEFYLMKKNCKECRVLEKCEKKSMITEINSRNIVINAEDIELERWR